MVMVQSQWLKADSSFLSLCLFECIFLCKAFDNKNEQNQRLSWRSSNQNREERKRIFFACPLMMNRKEKFARRTSISLYTQTRQHRPFTHKNKPIGMQERSLPIRSSILSLNEGYIYVHIVHCALSYLYVLFSRLIKLQCRQKLKPHRKDQRRLWPRPAKVQLDPKVKRNKNADEKKPTRSTSTRSSSRFTLIRVSRRKLCRSCKLVWIRWTWQMLIILSVSLGTRSWTISSNVSLLNHRVCRTTTSDRPSRLEKFKQPFDFCCLVNWPNTLCRKAPKLWPNTPAPSKLVVNPEMNNITLQPF